MTIFRVKKEARFTIIDNNLATDSRLSFGARGLLLYLLSKPDNWETRMCDLVAASPAGRTAVTRMVKELEDHGYMRRIQERGEDGTYGPGRTEVYEQPQSGFLNTDNLKSENKPLISTEKKIKTDWKKREGNAHMRKNGASAAPSASPSVPEGGNSHAKTFKAITGYWVGMGMQDFLQQRLGEQPDWDTVGWAYEQWTTRGYNPRNLRGVLEWYEKRVADPQWTPDGKGQATATGPDFGQLFEEGFQSFANRRLKLADNGFSGWVIDTVNELGRGRFQNCTEKDKPFLKREFVAVAAKHYKVPA